MGQTTITIDDDTKDVLDRHKPDNKTWGEYLKAAVRGGLDEPEIDPDVDVVENARSVTDDFDESWGDVLTFYADWREPIDERIADLMDGEQDMNGPVTLEATEYSKIADEVEERLR